MQTQPDRDEESHQVAANARRALEQAIVTITKRPIDSHLSYLIDAMIRASKLDRETLTSTIQPGSLNSPTSAVDNTSNSNDTDHSNDVPGVPVDFVEDGHVPTTSNDGFEHLHFDKRGKAFFAFCHICNANTSKRSVRKYARGRSERIPYMDGAALLLHYESAHPHRNGARQWTDILDYCGKIYPSDSDVERLNSGRQPRNMAIVRPRLRPKASSTSSTHHQNDLPTSSMSLNSERGDEHSYATVTSQNSQTSQTDRTLRRPSSPIVLVSCDDIV